MPDFWCKTVSPLLSRQIPTDFAPAPTQWGAHYNSWGITYLGDDLYCHQPHCERVLSQHANFAFTCKPDSHETLYEGVEDFSRIGGG